ncbi:MAG: sugar transferase [Anaerolineales bacterium]|nr:sugar transferase [Anaerolineales bacterium]MCB8965312.1 sugar transferase [Ardenticatenaceae bacterium]
MSEISPISWQQIHAELEDYAPARPVAGRVLWGLFILAWVLTDFQMVVLAFWFSFRLRYLTGGADPFIQLFHGFLTFLLIPLWLLIFGIFGLYNPKNLLNGFREYGLIWRAATIGMLSVVIGGFMERNQLVDRWWLLLAWGLSIFFMSIGRFWLRRIAYVLRQRGFLLSRALIVGANEEGRVLAEQLLHHRSAGLYVVGFADDQRRPGTHWAGVPVLGRVKYLPQFIRQHNVDELIVCTSACKREEMLTLFKTYGVVKGLNLRLSSGLFEIITTGLEVSEVAFVPLTRVNTVRLTGINRSAKLVLDYLVVLPFMLIGLPLFLVILLAVKLDSPGPIFHRRRVLGMNGKQFDAFKFRTMYVNGDEILAQYPELQAELAQNHKLKDDPRITRIGRFLRHYSLDELPQFWNVLRQEMSLIGPRMIAPEEIAMYSKWDINLLTVRPGITGMWQVSGRSDIAYDERVRLDMFYVRNWTIWLDISLLMRTIPAVIAGRGAY